VEFIGHRPTRLVVPVLGSSTSQGRELLRRTTRAMQKVKETQPTWSKSKGKGKVKVDDGLFNEAWSEELAKLKAKRVAIQTMINQMEG
jgi:hypothetical protein